MRRKIKMGFIFLLLFIMIFGGSYIIYSFKDMNTEKVDVVLSMVEEQYSLEKDFDTKGHTIKNPKVILNPYKISPLTALVMFETKTKVSPKVTIVGKDENTTITHTFEKDNKHYLPIYGLYADSVNEVIIEYKENGKRIEKKLEIKTEKLPEDFILPTSVYANKEELDDELYFYTPSSKGYTCAYDVNGDVRWYLNSYALWKIDKLENGHLLVSTERLVNNPYYMTGLYEMDLLGKIYFEYSLEGGYHHDYFEMENGNLLIASDNFNGTGTVEDYIVEINRQTGKIVKRFDLKDILDMESGKSENWSSYDWFHNNSVWYDKETNSITLSGRHQDAVINIDYKSGELNWIIGDPTNWNPKYKKYFFTPIGEDFEWQWSQHAAMITPEGYVFILDNGNNKSKLKNNYVLAEDSYTRGVMYKIDTNNMTIEQVWEYGKERGSEFYSPYISDVDYLNRNHYIVHSGGIVYVNGKNSNQPAGLGGYDKLVSDTVEIKDDIVIFELILPTNNYRVEKMDLYSKDEVFTLGKAYRIGSLGKTKEEDERFALSVLSEKMDKEYESHNISLTKEIDRLVVKGQFKRGTDVKIVLYGDMKLRTYQFKVSKKPYTALCVDVFTEEENENGIVVTKYINEDGLNGIYSIYIEIDGILYNTNKYVKF